MRQKATADNHYSQVLGIIIVLLLFCPFVVFLELVDVHFQLFEFLCVYPVRIF